MQPERIIPPNPNAEDEAHDANVQRDLDDHAALERALAQKRAAAGMSAEQLSLLDAFIEDGRAGYIGTAAGLNPYQHGTPEHDEWERGRMGALGYRMAGAR